MICYVYSYQKDTDTTQFCSFERGVYLYFCIKVCSYIYWYAVNDVRMWRIWINKE